MIAAPRLQAPAFDRTIGLSTTEGRVCRMKKYEYLYVGVTAVAVGVYTLESTQPHDPAQHGWHATEVIALFTSADGSLTGAP